LREGGVWLGDDVITEDSTTRLRGWLRISQVSMVINVTTVTVVTKVALGIRHRHLRAEVHNCPILIKIGMLKNFIQTPQYQIS
jgi:hypothetical protein